MKTQEDANKHFDERLRVLEAGGGGTVDPDFASRLIKLEENHDDNQGHDSGNY